jgi:hypothetical protein
LSQRPLGFSVDNLLAIDVAAHSPEPAVYWAQVMDHLRGLHGIEAAAISGWAPFSGQARGTTSFRSMELSPDLCLRT